MNVLALFASAVLTKESEIDRSAVEPLSHQGEILQKRPPREPIAPVTPVAQLENQLEVQSIREWNRVQDLVQDPETPDSEPEKPYSPTVVLEGEVNVGVSGVSGSDRDNSVELQESVEFLLNMSFTGEDQLQVGLESGNAAGFGFTDELTSEGRLSLPTNTEGDRFELSELSYEFPVGDRTSLYVSAAGNDLADFNPFFGDSGSGAISEFGTENPIDSLVGDFGLQLNYELTDALGLSLGYFSGNASNSKPGAGLFNGDYSAFVQLGFEPDDRFLLGFTYIYTHSDASLETDTGSLRSQINLDSPVIGSSYGLAASVSPSSHLAIGGWIGYTHATVNNLGNAEVLNYALTLALPDLGGKGNLLGVIVGQEPRLTHTSGFKIDDRRSDPDTSLHIEAFYRDRLSDHISITPGLIWITAPNYDRSNPDIFIFTVRTTFSF